MVLNDGGDRLEEGTHARGLEWNRDCLALLLRRPPPGAALNLLALHPRLKFILTKLFVCGKTTRATLSSRTASVTRHIPISEVRHRHNLALQSARSVIYTTPHGQPGDCWTSRQSPPSSPPA